MMLNVGGPCPPPLPLIPKLLQVITNFIFMDCIIQDYILFSPVDMFDWHLSTLIQHCFISIISIFLCVNTPPKYLNAYNHFTLSKQIEIYDNDQIYLNKVSMSRTGNKLIEVFKSSKIHISLLVHKHMQNN